MKSLQTRCDDDMNMISHYSRNFKRGRTRDTICQQVYCTRCAFCAAVELLQIHWTTFFAQRFLPKFYTAPQPAADRSRLDALLKRCKRYGYCDKNLPAIADMFSDADDQLFERVNRNSNHVLEPRIYQLNVNVVTVWDRRVMRGRLLTKPPNSARPTQP